MKLELSQCGRCEIEWDNSFDFEDFIKGTERCAGCELLFCGNECFAMHECPFHPVEKFSCAGCGQIVDILEKGEGLCLTCEGAKLEKVQ